MDISIPYQPVECTFEFSNNKWSKAAFKMRDEISWPQKVRAEPNVTLSGDKESARVGAEIQATAVFFKKGPSHCKGPSILPTLFHCLQQEPK